MYINVKFINIYKNTKKNPVLMFKKENYEESFKFVNRKLSLLYI